MGANCTVVCGITIGQYAFIGAGAVVTHDVPAYALMVGNPARVRGWMCACGIKLDFPTSGPEVRAMCVACGAQYLKRDGMVTAVQEAAQRNL